MTPQEIKHQAIQRLNEKFNIKEIRTSTTGTTTYITYEMTHREIKIKHMCIVEILSDLETFAIYIKK